MEIVLLGATGSLGSAISEEILSSHGLSGSPVLHTPRRGELDLFSFESVVSFFDSVQPQVVIDAAGQLEIGESGFPNLDITRNLVLALEASSFSGTLIRFGSALAYGALQQARTSGFREDEFQNSLQSLSGSSFGIYAQDKRLATLETLGFAGDFKIVNLMLSNLYVPERLLTSSTRKHVIPSTIARLAKAYLQGQQHVQVPSPLHITREFTHVGDIAAWVNSKLSGLDDLPNMLNLGSGQALSIEDVNVRISSLFGSPFSFQGTDDDSSQGAPFSSRLDSGLAISVHHWNPREDAFAKLLEEFPLALRG